MILFLRACPQNGIFITFSFFIHHFVFFVRFLRFCCRTLGLCVIKQKYSLMKGHKICETWIQFLWSWCVCSVTYCIFCRYYFGESGEVVECTWRKKYENSDSVFEMKLHQRFVDSKRLKQFDRIGKCTSSDSRLVASGKRSAAPSTLMLRMCHDHTSLLTVVCTSR